jgi:thymidylate synthase
MESTEKQYLDVAKQILENGELRKTRNGNTKSIFGAQIKVTELKEGKFPLLTSRKHFYKGIAGEYSAFLKGPKNIKDFEKEGCNYWKLWADNEDGDIRVDYGNAWLDFNGVNQIDYCLDLLKNDRTSRRIMISGWNPEHVINNELSLPCCHYMYQFYVSEDKYLNLKFIQRSVDWAIGCPSDIILASLMVLTFAKATGLKPGEIILDFTDVHLYEEHLDTMKEQINGTTYDFPTYTETLTDSVYNFNSNQIKLDNYQYNGIIKYLLKS